MPRKPVLEMTRETRLSCLAYSAKNTLNLIFAFFAKLAVQEEIAVLMYHSVDLTSNVHSVDPKEFTRQIEYLRKNYAIVSLNEMADFARGSRKAPRKAVAVTFDDGSQDLYLSVYPYFRKNKLPATVFISTGYVGKQWPFYVNPQKMLGWNEIEEMSRNNFEIGAHTVHHQDLRNMSLEEALKEISESKIEIENHIKKSVNFFSYPFGSYTPEVVNVVKSLGFKSAVGGSGTISINPQIFNLNRIQVDRSISFTVFIARLTKAFDLTMKLEMAAHGAWRLLFSTSTRGSTTLRTALHS